LANLIRRHAIEGDSLAEFVGLHARDDGYTMFLCKHGYESGSCAGVECTVRVQGGGAEEHEGCAREERGEEREEKIGAWKAGRGERVKEMAACVGNQYGCPRSCVRLQGKTEMVEVLMCLSLARLTLEKWSRVDDDHFERG
jgi:hypothetical protein